MKTHNFSIVVGTRNRLANTRAYLCGAMDRVKDRGVGWRGDLQRRLRDLGIVWLDPTDKPIQVGAEDEDSRRKCYAAKAAGDWDTIAKYMKMIRTVDLRMVDVADWLVVDLDLEVHATGSYEELFLANRQKKPVLVHVRQGKDFAPNWLFGTIPHQHIFGTWNELCGYIRGVSKAHVVETFGRWYFFDWTGK